MIGCNSIELHLFMIKGFSLKHTLNLFISVHIMQSNDTIKLHLHLTQSESTKFEVTSTNNQAQSYSQTFCVHHFHLNIDIWFSCLLKWLIKRYPHNLK